jgi:beta-lactam-binding protein with PASTA domain
MYMQSSSEQTKAGFGKKFFSVPAMKERWGKIRIFCSENRKIFILIFIYFTFFLCVSTLILVLLTKPEGEVKVPDVVGKKFTAVYGTLERKGIKPSLKFYNTFDAEDGLILSQYPDAGTVISEGDRLDITISRNSLSLDTPSLIGKELPIARNMLKNLHIGERTISIGVGVISYVYSEKSSENIVLDQSPKPGEKINPEQKINILVSAGKTGDDNKMPDITGQSIDLCFPLLQAKGVVVNQEVVNAANPGESGRIMSQEPAKDTALTAGQQIKLKVAYYPKEAKFYHGYEKLIYKVDDDEKEGLFEAYVEDYEPSRVVSSMKLKGGQTLQCVFQRTGNARVTILRNKKAVKVLRMNVEDF